MFFAPNKNKENNTSGHGIQKRNNFLSNEKCSINKNHAKNIEKRKKTKTFRRNHAKNFLLNF